jgi:EAL domain-containing protein (putative c-di-GMP-specific phosphodiesterase class I)
VIADLRFLVVEDHAFQRAVLVRLLETLGARHIASAADGRAAMAICEGGACGPDIVITDLEMPGMDGIEFLRHIGQGARPVSVILASAADDAVLASVHGMADAYGVRVLGALRKPVRPAELESLLRLHEGGPGHGRGTQPPPRARAPHEIIEGLRVGQFEPFFQPKVELASGRLRGFEALARWRVPAEGIVPPAAFIPALEGHTAMEVLTWAMLERSAAACAGWRAHGLATTVSVNISPTALADVAFSGRLAALVAGQGLEPAHLILEVTESAAVRSDSGPAMENLSRLRLLGFGLACDDFGTGYASMQQLARVAFTELKIDQGFVRQSRSVREGATARVILRATLAMARELGLVSVGEGVETREEWDLLHALGCEQAQGYFIARPMEGARVLDWARAHAHDLARFLPAATGATGRQRSTS